MRAFFDIVQRSPEWWVAKRGRPSASQFHRIITPKTFKPSASQDEYIDELVAETIDQQFSQESENQYISSAMQNGIDNEPMARAWYAFDRDVDVREVGYCESNCGRYVCSPDGLIYRDGLLVKGIEVKCPELKTHLRYLREGVLPSEYKCQVHGYMAVTGTPWDFVSYSPVASVESLVVTVVPDDFTSALKTEVEKFCTRLEHEKSKILSMA